MNMQWINSIAEIYGVTAALLVDHDGIVIAQAGDVSDTMAPHSTLLVQKLIKNIGLETVNKWNWTQCETNDMVYGIANVDVGILVIVMKNDANLGMVRLHARAVRQDLKMIFSDSFGE